MSLSVATPLKVHVIEGVTLPAKLPVGEMFETNHWRVVRFYEYAEITELAHAGLSKARCARITIGAQRGKHLGRLDLFVSGILESLTINPSASTLQEVAKEAILLSPVLVTWTDYIDGEDVDPGVVRIVSDGLRARFTVSEFLLTLTTTFETEKGLVQTVSHFSAADRASAWRAFRWARANDERIATMDRRQVLADMKKATIRAKEQGPSEAERRSGAR